MRELFLLLNTIPLVFTHVADHSTLSYMFHDVRSCIFDTTIIFQVDIFRYNTRPEQFFSAFKGYSVDSSP